MFLKTFGRGAYFRASLNVSLAKTLVTRMSNIVTENGPVAQVMHSKLMSQANPVHLEIINESYMHNVPKGSETHFKVLVVSESFEGLPLLKRHRFVNKILEEELQTGVHALSIVAKTPSQWAESEKTVSPSPSCRGGFGK